MNDVVDTPTDTINQLRRGRTDAFAGHLTREALKHREAVADGASRDTEHRRDFVASHPVGVVVKHDLLQVVWNGSEDLNHRGPSLGMVCMLFVGRGLFGQNIPAALFVAQTVEAKVGGYSQQPRHWLGMRQKALVRTYEAQEDLLRCVFRFLRMTKKVLGPSQNLIVVPPVKGLNASAGYVVQVLSRWAGAVPIHFGIDSGMERSIMRVRLSQIENSPQMVRAYY